MAIKYRPGSGPGWTTGPPANEYGQSTALSPSSEPLTSQFDPPTSSSNRPTSHSPTRYTPTPADDTYSRAFNSFSGVLMLGGIISSSGPDKWEGLKKVSPWLISDFVSYVAYRFNSEDTPWSKPLCLSTCAAAATYSIGGPLWNIPCAFGLTFGMSIVRSGSETANSGSGWRSTLGLPERERPLSDDERV
ncbi:hypothetical protein BCR39DRAFT_559106 [Naematelia encephala]|uniref:Uncharacterized protein n=1 Tax=Naematelia encephala TaxID=71784 RepID=A0A1Y2B397_9TREE|nr:hypothetical protein BCR39DRAFT_559106 [Naematelia encephala]